MNTALLIENYPTEQAYQFCLSTSDKINCIFFYGEGVRNCLDPRWQALSSTHPLFACAKSIDIREIDPGNMQVAGLATFVAHAIDADQVMQFKAGSA